MRDRCAPPLDPPRLRLVQPHARQRLCERYGRSLTDTQWRQVVLAILASVEGGGPCLYLGEAAAGTERWGVQIPGTDEWMPVIWSPGQGCIRTVLTPWPPEMWRKARLGQTEGQRNDPRGMPSPMAIAFARSVRGRLETREERAA